MGVLSPNFFQGHITREHVFYRRRPYVLWQSFEKIGAETAEKACLKKPDAKYNESES